MAYIHFVLMTLAVSIAAVSPGFGCFTGLTLIPTAETVGRGTVSLEPQLDVALSPTRTQSRVFNTQCGFGDRFEAGVDFDLSDDADQRFLWNAKYVLLPAAGAVPAVAAGVFNVSSGMRAAPYLTCTAQLRGFNLHFGGLRSESRNRWFVGLHRPTSSRTCVMADRISGDENFYAVGLEYALGGNMAVLVGKQYPNGSGDSILTLHFIVTLER